MNRRLLALFLVLLMVFQINGQSTAAADSAQEVEKQTVRDMGKGTDGYFVTPEGDVTISSRAYANNTKLVYVIVADSVKTIEDEAFAGCVNLRYVFLPKSVTSLGKNVFKGCPRFYWKEGAIVSGMTVKKGLLRRCGISCMIKNYRFRWLLGMRRLFLADRLCVILKLGDHGQLLHSDTWSRKRRMQNGK